MPPTNDYLPWAIGPNPNILTQQAYVNRSDRSAGVVDGIASAQQANKTWRQTSMMAAMIAQFIVDTLTVDVFDDGVLTTLEANFIAAIKKTFVIPNTGITPGVYPQANVTVQADGRINGIANGRQANYAVDTGAANAYLIQLNPAPAPAAMGTIQGVLLSVLISHTNTGPSTLNANSMGVFPIVDPKGNTLVAGRLLAGGIYQFTFDGTNFQMIAGLYDTGVTPGTYALPTVTVQSDGRVTAISSTTQLVYNGVATYTASGSFTVPAGVTRVEVEVWGGGAGGSGNLTGQIGNPGSAGAYGRKLITGLTPGQVIPVTVAITAAAGASGGGTGQNGGTSSFGTFLSCAGGIGGLANTGAGLLGAAAPVGADLGIAGGGCSASGFGGFGGAPQGKGGDAPQGGGGGLNSVSGGSPGLAPGGGGGSGGSPTGPVAGGTGGRGEVIVRW